MRTACRHDGTSDPFPGSNRPWSCMQSRERMLQPPGINVTMPWSCLAEQATFSHRLSSPDGSTPACAHYRPSRKKVPLPLTDDWNKACMAIHYWTGVGKTQPPVAHAAKLQCHRCQKRDLRCSTRQDAGCLTVSCCAILLGKAHWKKDQQAQQMPGHLFVALSEGARPQLRWRARSAVWLHTGQPRIRKHS